MAQRTPSKGQAMAEFALVLPLLVLLLAGMILAGFYAFRAASADLGVFLSGVAAGTYDTPAVERARSGLLWGDIRSGLQAGQSAEREVRSSIQIDESRMKVLGVDFIEAQRGASFFRRWRFYAGPPAGEIE